MDDHVRLSVSLSAHVLVHPGDDCHAIRRELEQMLQERFDIEHTTLQVDHETARVLTIGAAARSMAAIDLPGVTFKT